ncbi:MAG: hypothetical protein JWM14_236 [Chitinophagaceae bacterium]|nr:hypothetical protein [Chitinophagaceae bacterium]
MKAELILRTKVLLLLFLILYSCNVSYRSNYIKWGICKSDSDKNEYKFKERKISSNIVIDSNLCINKQTLDKVCNINSEGALWEFYKIDSVELVIVKSKVYDNILLKDRLYKIQVTQGEFNEDLANTFFYSTRYGVIIKIIKTGRSKHLQYRNITNEKMDSYSKMILSDTFFFEKPLSK